MQIAPHLPRIGELIVSNAVISVIAPTGSGKSVGIPALAGANGWRCFAVVPTRTAAISLSEYQRALQNQITGNMVGYAAEGNVHYTDKTMIAYVTGGHARRKMLSYFSNGKISPINFCDVLMVDEVHAGSVDTTMILSLWYAAAKSGVSVPRLVVASATPVPMYIDVQAATYEVPVVGYPIEIKYENSTYPLEESSKLYKAAAAKAHQIHSGTSITTGHILIFAAGANEVEKISNHLKDLLNNDKSALIIPAFGALSQEDLALIYKETKIDERKIVISTNIAEMSITIQDIGHVIDTMTEKRAETAQNGGFRLSIHYISKDSAKQRAGRTGRTRPGICYRMCDEKTFNSFEQHRPLEIERVPIYEIVMELYNAGLSPENILKGVNLTKITESTKVLSQLDMISNVSGKIIVTNKGQFAPKLSLSVRNAAFLWDWLNYSGLRFNKKIIEEGKLYGYNYEHFEIDESSEYSTLLPSQMEQVRNIYAAEISGNVKTIIDATANVGGDTFNFAKLIPTASIISLEKDKRIAEILQRNVDNMQKIIGINSNVKVINISAVNYFESPKIAELVYFDPPWGGRNYTEKDKMDLYLDEISINAIINNILNRGYTSLVILKAPKNIDIEHIQEEIPHSIKMYDVLKPDREIAYKLFFIRSNNIPLNKHNVVVEFPPIQSVAPKYPPFPGIVVASLIDCYGPTYYWTPRRDREETLSEYNSRASEHRKKHFDKFRGYNDLETAMNMWSDMMKTVNGLDSKNKEVSKWCKANSINNKKIRELLLIVEQSVKIVEKTGFPVKVGPFTTNKVNEAAKPFLLKVYSDMTLIHSKESIYFNPLNRDTYKLDNRDSINKYAEQYPLGVIALITAEIKTESALLKIINFSVDTEKDGLGRPILRKETKATTKTNPDLLKALDMLKSLKDIKPIVVEKPAELLDITIPKASNAPKLIDLGVANTGFTDKEKEEAEQLLSNFNF